MTSRRRLASFKTILAGAAMAAALSVPISSSAEIAELRSEFSEPPAQARPWTWFHVMSGNMTREGVTKDLESLADVGVGGIVLFHVTQGISHGPVKFNTPEHLDLIVHVAAECERLGLAFNFHNADGWSSTGGPWVTPEQSMKRVVWKEVMTSGGDVDLQIETPATQEGFYEDIAVLAYPSLASELADAQASPVITASDHQFDLAKIADGDFTTRSELAVPDDEVGWVQYAYDKPTTIRSVRVENTSQRDVVIGLEASEDGQDFQPVETFTKERIGKNEWHVGATIAPVTARYFRVTFDRSHTFGEVALSQSARVDKYASNVSLAHRFGATLQGDIEAPAGEAIDPSKVIDLTGMMDANGALQAELPQGSWTIMRFGHTSTGARNVNPSPEGDGLEVDKFDARAFGTHYDAFLKPVIERARAVAPNALAGIMIDSYEVGGQNWTSGYEDQFEAKYGFALTPWLPLYAGRVVGSGSQTRDMLATIRDFNSELINENYFGAFADLMQKDELESLIQPYGFGPLDEVGVGRIASMPAGEFWVRRDDLTYLNGAVSAGRLYDKPIIAAEAWTATGQVNWNFTPAFGKRWGDRAWTAGVNHFFFHRFAHQANTHVAPGMTMNRWGSHFDRTQPWWDKGGKAWFTYMARGAHMLREGTGVSDIGLFVGSDSPVECPDRFETAGSLPAGYAYDCIDAPTLLERATFENGAFVLPNGARYKMLWWAHESAPTEEEMARLLEARAAGIPVALAHLGDDVKDVIAEAGIAPRISSDGALPLFTHRKLGDTDIVFLSNFEERPRDFALRFDLGGKAAQLWDPTTGETREIFGSVDDQGLSHIHIALAASGSTFLVFDPAFTFAAEPMPALTPAKELVGPWSIAFDQDYAEIDDIQARQLFDWSFSNDEAIHHFSGKAVYQTHFALEASDIAGQDRIVLDLGKVGNVATVRVNGIEVGTAWTAPYSVDVTDAVKAGDNALEIEVANLWVNRLIGDAALEDTSGYKPEGRIPQRDMVEWYSANEPPPEGPRKTFSTHYFQSADDPLVPSGLIGPVILFKE